MGAALRAAFACALVVVVAAVAGSARAGDPVQTLPPPPPPPTSLETMASHIVKGLYGPTTTPLPEGTAFALVVEFDKPPEGARPDALVTHLADALEAALRAYGRGKAGPRVTGDDASERVEVELQVQMGHIAATARRRGLPKTVWSALMSPDGQVLGTAFANVPVDLEIRTLLGLGRRDVKLGELKVVPVGKKSVAALAGQPILDLVVGDFDGDATPELAALQPDGVRFLRWAKGGFSEEVGVFSLRQAAPAKARVRVPLGKLVPVVRGDGRTVLVAASSDRAEAVAIGWGAGGPEKLSLMFQKGWPLYATGVDRFLIAPWPEGQDVIDGSVTEARFGTAAAAWLGPIGRAYDVRAFGHREASGAFDPIVVGMRPGGELAANVGGTAARMTDAGTVAVWVDLDGDGEVEALSTSTVLSGPDRLTLARGVAPGAIPARWVGQAAAPVTAATAGDVDRDGFVEVVMATWNGRAADLVVVVPK